MYICVYVCVYVYIYVHVCMYVYVYVCVHWCFLCADSNIPISVEHFWVYQSGGIPAVLLAIQLYY